MVYDKNISSAEIGKAGELRVATELLLRNLKPAIFYADTGTDIILENGKKIGVKTATKSYFAKKTHSTRYYISFGQVKIKQIGENWKKTYQFRDYTKFVDYWIIWLIDIDVFYIIPNGETGKKLSLTIETPDELRTNKKFNNYKSRSKYEKYKNNWDQLMTDVYIIKTLKNE